MNDDVALRVAVEVCAYCGQKVPLNERTVDHEPPRSTMRGVEGVRRYRRLMACGPCNGLKGSRTEAQFRAWLETRNGLLWLAIREREVATGRVSAERDMIPGAPGAPGARRSSVASKRSKRVMVKAYQEAERMGWTPEEIRRRWRDPVEANGKWRDR